jgi:uncharacterized membrane protein YqjE
MENGVKHPQIFLHMNSITKNAVSITTLLIIISLAAGILLHNIVIISIIFAIANIAIVWMVYRVLHSGKSSDFTFEQKQFEDN